MHSFTRPPVMTQWVVYTIRNLTEDNSQNQELIAGLEKQGLVDASLLTKLGFEVEKRGDKLLLKSTREAPQPVSARGGLRPSGLRGSVPASPAPWAQRGPFSPTQVGALCLLKWRRRPP